MHDRGRGEMPILHVSQWGWVAVLLSSVFWKKNKDLVLKTDGQHLGKGDYRAMSYLGKYRTSFPNYLLLGFSTHVIFLQANQRVVGLKKQIAVQAAQISVSSDFIISLHRLSSSSQKKSFHDGRTQCALLSTALLEWELLFTCSVISHMMLVCLHWTNKHKQEQVQIKWADRLDLY